MNTDEKNNSTRQQTHRKEQSTCTIHLTSENHPPAVAPGKAEPPAKNCQSKLYYKSVTHRPSRWCLRSESILTMRSQVLAFFYEIQIGPQTTNKARERNPRPRRIVDTQLSRVKWPEALKVWIASGTGDLHLAAMANCAGVETGCRSNWVCLRPQQQKLPTDSIR